MFRVAICSPSSSGIPRGRHPGGDRSGALRQSLERNTRGSRFRSGPDVIWFAFHEPERTQRVARLAYANWFSQCVRRPRDRVPLAPLPNELALVDATVDRKAPAAARSLTAHATTGWFRSCLAARHVLEPARTFVGDLAADNRSLAELRLTLASEMHLREHGADPPTRSSLVDGEISTSCQRATRISNMPPTISGLCSSVILKPTSRSGSDAPRARSRSDLRGP
jgi:hypothetical protein